MVLPMSMAKIIIQFLAGSNLSVIAVRCRLSYRGEALAYRKAPSLRQRLPYQGSWREAPERVYGDGPAREPQA